VTTSAQSGAGFDLRGGQQGAGEVSPVVLVRTTDGGWSLRAGNIAALYEFLQRVQAEVRVDRVESLVIIDSRLSRSQYQQLYALQAPELIVDAYA
jgi:RND superfamily putative drug exporter